MENDLKITNLIPNEDESSKSNLNILEKKEYKFDTPESRQTSN